MDKKRLYFISSSIFQILIAFSSFLMLDTLKKNTLSAINYFPEGFRSKLIDVYSNDLVYIVPNIILLVLGLIILILVIRKSLGYCRNYLLAFSIIGFLVGTSIFVSIISIVNIIVSLTVKSLPKEKTKIPDLVRVDVGSKYVKLAIIPFVVYFSQIFFPTFDNFILKVIFAILFYIIMLSVCIFCFFDNIKRDWIEFKKNFKAYVLFLIPRLIVMYILYFIISAVSLYVLNDGVPVNQQQIEALPLWYLIPIASIYAPIVEEIMFRGCLRRFIKNDIIFIIVSGFIFGLLHTLGEESLYSMFTLMIPYAFAGCFFSYIYVKTNNILSNIACHSFHNTLATVIQILFIR